MSSTSTPKEIEEARKKFAEMYGDVKLGGKGILNELK